MSQKQSVVGKQDNQSFHLLMKLKNNFWKKKKHLNKQVMQ